MTIITYKPAITFVLYQLKNLFSLNHFLIIVLYSSFAWFLSQPTLDPAAIYSSRKLTAYYDIILLSFGMLSFILAVIDHFQNNLQQSSSVLAGCRLSKNQIMWGLISSYMVFFLIGFSIPMYFIALMQQWFYAAEQIHIEVFLLKPWVVIHGYVFFWLIVSLALIIRFRNQFIVLMIFTTLYGLSYILSFVLHGMVFNQHWFVSIYFNDTALWQNIVLEVSGYVASLGTALCIGTSIARRLHEIELLDPFRIGLFARFAEQINAFLSMHHLRMMGFGSQKILSLFSFIGLAFTLVLVTLHSGELIVFGKIYIGALLPVLFSFNQYYIIQLDRDAGMIHNNYLRLLSYSYIIFHRWALLLIPQIVVTLSCSLVILIVTGKLSYAFVVYLLLINVFCSLFNLMSSIVTKSVGTANLLLLLFVYIQLRQDVQDFIFSLPLVNHINIFYPLLQESNLISSSYWISSILFVTGMIFIIIRQTQNPSYA